MQPKILELETGANDVYRHFLEKENHKSVILKKNNVNQCVHENLETFGRKIK